jgi:hypothetical protein
MYKFETYLPTIQLVFVMIEVNSFRNGLPENFLTLNMRRGSAYYRITHEIFILFSVYASRLPVE